MSSLHPDRLPSEGAAPAQGTQQSLSTDPGTTSRRTDGHTSVTAPVTADGTARRTTATHDEGNSRTGAAAGASPTTTTAPAAGRRPWPWQRPPAVRRPAAYLAAALAGAVSLGVLTSAGPSAQAETRTVSHSVSVAEQLGIADEPTEAITDADVDERLGELTASRAERDKDRADAQKKQAKADKKAEAKAKAAAKRKARAAAAAARPKAVLPVKGARLTSGFGARWGTQHAGIDLAAPMRTPEYAVKDGVVLEAGPASGYGLAVYLQHDNGDVTVYGHMDEILVQPGQVVKAGDTIALLGNRGQSTGPHLHFEVIKGGLDGTKVDPIPWLRAAGLKI